MNEDCLKLTTYFGERDRVDGGLMSDRLMDIYGSKQLRASVLLRGSEGFGRRRHLHTDRLLTLSEDLPVISIAVDERTRIEAALQDVLKIKRRGLVTLERARMLTGEIGSVELPEQLHEATKLTIYLGRQQRIGQRPAYIAVCELLHTHGLVGANALLGVDGTRHGDRHRARFFGRNADVPMMIIAVGEGERIAALLPRLGQVLEDPLLTLERVRVCKRAGQLLSEPHELPATDGHGLPLWQKLTVYSSNNVTHEGRPLYLEIVRRLLEADAAGVTALRGIWGFHGDQAPHGDRFFQLRRQVPVYTVVIDAPERIAASFKIIDEVTAEHGLVTSEMVPAVALINGATSSSGLRLADHEF